MQRRARPVIRDFFERNISVDAFAGGAGAATGTKAATGREVDIAINHDPLAIAVFQDNNPNTECYRADVFSIDPVKACRGRHVRHLHASPDCRHHSRAKGGAPVSESVRALADIVPIWAEKVRPDVITLENVPEFLDWGPLHKTGPQKGKPIKERKGEFFAAWKRKLEALGYVVEHRVLIAYHYGAPTSRKRLFLVARCDGQPIVWPEPTHGSPAERKENPRLKRWRTAAECIDWDVPAPSIFERKRPLAAATLRRIAAGLVKFVLNNHKPLTTVVAGGQKHALVEAFLAPFIAKHYGDPQRKTGGGVVLGQPVTQPLSTITTVDHHSLAGVTLAPEQLAHAYPNAVKVLPFLAAYYGEGSGKVGHSINVPLPTITTHERFALVTVVVDGKTYAIVDIGLRMLTPRELLRAQFGPYAKGYRLDSAKSTRDQVRLIGNSVVPQMQEAVVRANLGDTPQMRRAA